MMSTFTIIIASPLRQKNDIELFFFFTKKQTDINNTALHCVRKRFPITTR